MECWRQTKNDSVDWDWERVNTTRKAAYRRMAVLQHSECRWVASIGLGPAPDRASLLINLPLTHPRRSWCSEPVQPTGALQLPIVPVGAIRRRSASALRLVAFAAAALDNQHSHREVVVHGFLLINLPLARASELDLLPLDDASDIVRHIKPLVSCIRPPQGVRALHATLWSRRTGGIAATRTRGSAFLAWFHSSKCPFPIATPSQVPVATIEAMEADLFRLDRATPSEPNCAGRQQVPPG